VCPYHGWTYNLRGQLRGVPHDSGFPDLRRDERGLIGLDTREKSGVVFVSQRPTIHAFTNEVEDLPDLIPPRFRLVRVEERDVPVNWKIAVEGFLEGYHIRATHPDTFFPIQYDNINVREVFGRNSRITFPYRSIEKLREVEPAKRSADGRLTYAYHLFPNVIVATVPGRMNLIALEPLTVGTTRYVTYTLSDHHDGSDSAEGVLDEEESFVNKGAKQDREVMESIQRSLASNPHEAFEFGLFEGSIGHFHRELTDSLQETR
jgi:phenylpropionate dioxygenase-like ring-hydroxylating dioxygenase large terminal subunit